MVVETVPKDILDKLNAGIEITGTDLDIRPLTNATDSITATNYVWDGSDWQASAGKPSGASVSFFEWLADNGTLITARKAVTNGNVAVYTVPANKVFYLVSASINWRNSAATSGTNCRAYIDSITESTSLFHEFTTATDTDHATISATYPIPLKLTAGRIIYVQSLNTNQSVNLNIVGYEIDA